MQSVRWFGPREILIIVSEAVRNPDRMLN